jgi:hypothetical protein
MSVNWLEHYPGDHRARLAAVIGNLRVNLDIRPKSAFAIANVGALENCCKQSGSSVKIESPRESRRPVDLSQAVTACSV